MKVLCHMADRPVDFSKLYRQIPELHFVEARTDEEFGREIVDADILIGWTADYSLNIAELARRNARQLKFVHVCTSGIDTPLKHGGFPQGVVVANVAGLKAITIAEHGMALLLNYARRLPELEAARRAGRWLRRDAYPLVTLQGLTIALLGMGHVGQAIAKRAKAFEMRVIGISRGYRPDALVEEVVSRENIRDALRQADALMICAPSDSGTLGIIDAEKLACMKRNAILINLARGDIVVEADLMAALKERTIAAAALDVMMQEPPDPSSPIWTLDNLFMTPHLAGIGRDETEALIAMLADNLRLYLAGKPLKRVVFRDGQLVDSNLP